MQIGELAKRSAVTVQTVRFYERLRLLPEPQRKDSGYRVYSEPDLKRLLFVRQAKSLGFSLDEIRDGQICSRMNAVGLLELTGDNQCFMQRHWSKLGTRSGEQ